MPIQSHLARSLRLTLVSVVLVALPGLAHAGSHTWDVNEVFTDTTGNIQFIELIEANNTPNEVGVPGHTMTSNAKSFVIEGDPLGSPTSSRTYLMGTEAFAALPGAPTPDAIIPANVLPFFFSPGGDTVSYTPWDSFTFASAPSDGTTSLNQDGTTGPNSPKNYAGVSGSVDASPAPQVPAFSAWGLALLGLLLAVVGARAALQRFQRVLPSGA